MDFSTVYTSTKMTRMSGQGYMLSILLSIAVRQHNSHHALCSMVQLNTWQGSCAVCTLAQHAIV